MPVVNSIDPVEAMRELDHVVVRTAVRRLRWLERLVGVEVWGKLEFQQHTGSFKYRGAHLAISRGPGTPILAASAGNHGLAVAEAARRIGRGANICIPTVASRLKRERILSSDAGLIEFGNSLEEATEHARNLEAADGLHYISPYNDPDVIAGASTVGTEFLRQVPDLATMIVPMGGGGLVSGIGVAAEAMGVPLKLIGCEPEQYASITNSLAAGRITRVTHQPTLADGLAVNIEPDSITYELAKRHLDSTITLTEEELAAGTLALLVHESLLVEPAGAAGIAACLRLAAAGALTGPVGIPLCGGNLHHATLAKIQRFPYRDPELVRLLDLRGRSVLDTPIKWARPTAPATAASAELSTPEHDLLGQLDTCGYELDASLRELADFTAYAERHELTIEPHLVDQLTATVRDTASVLVKHRAALSSDAAGSFAAAESALRFGIATTTHVLGALEWCSPSYAQSRVAQFFNLGAQDSPTLNYERYEAAATRRVEEQLLAVLDLPPDDFAVTATSSGMAAYSLVEAFLLRERLEPGDVVLTAPYIYFEASEQLASLPFIRCVRSEAHDVEGILAAIAEHRPRCVFLDPVANTAEQRMIDIPRVLAALRDSAEHPITVVVDGTMVSGALSHTTLRGGGHLEVLYYESCSKYMQLGLDASMAGMVVHPVALSGHFDRLRRNTGTILYRRSAHLFPRFDRAHLQRRMHRICGNAATVAAALYDDAEVRDLGQVFYPGHRSHQDHAIASRLPYAGGCVTFLFHEQGLNHRDQLDALLEVALDSARRKGLDLTKGVSFGFSAPRISAAASMAETEPPFLRIYVGDRGRQQSDLLAEVMARAIVKV